MNIFEEKNNIVLYKLHLSNFRKMKNFLLEIEKPVCLVLAPNASGKTTILEAAQMLSNGESFRAGKSEEVIGFGEELGRTAGLIYKINTVEKEVTKKMIRALSAESLDEDDEKKEADRLEIMITRGLVQGKKTQSKLYTINQARRRKKDFIGQFGSVVFRPEDMRLIEGSPARRRSYFNQPLSVTDEEYALALKNYDQTLLRRNRLLSQIKDGKQNRETLTYWNLNLIKYGKYLQQKRAAYIEFCNEVAFPLEMKVEYVFSEISQARLDKYADAEIAVGHTLVGPHKDDLKVIFDFGEKSNLIGNEELGSLGHNWESIAIYGSRGQQRMAVLWLKLCELNFIENKLGQKPILLLDDILSELDDQSKELVLTLISKYQTIITSTEPRVQAIIEDQVGEIQLVRI